MSVLFNFEGLAKNQLNMVKKQKKSDFSYKETRFADSHQIDLDKEE